MQQPLTPLSIEVFSTVSSYRQWRQKAMTDGKTVGFVPTMGALHQGHLTLVKRSLAHNDITVVSIFVNPAQFAPHEDLATYPRTLPRDLELLQELAVQGIEKSTGIQTRKSVTAVFAPNVLEMYPSGIVQNVAEQKGAFIEVKGYSHQMEGSSRPTFFRGVATVVAKLFNVVQPTRAYFGQKDIQQALLLKRLCKDLLFGYPEHQNVQIVPTERDPVDNLALSSRNLYLTADGRKVATTLIEALQAAKNSWNEGHSKSECIEEAKRVVQARKARAEQEKLQVEMKLDYIEMNEAETFEIVEATARKTQSNGGVVILSGALYVDKTRLIDNVLLGSVDQIIASV